MSEEWSDWIEHDGKGCPCVGQFVHIQRANGDQRFLVAGADIVGKSGDINNPLTSNWAWLGNKPCHREIIRYRIRKPRALLDLIEMVENLPAPVGPKVDA